MGLFSFLFGLDEDKRRRHLAFVERENEVYRRIDSLRLAISRIDKSTPDSTIDSMISVGDAMDALSSILDIPYIDWKQYPAYGHGQSAILEARGKMEEIKKAQLGFPSPYK